jgi:hypothetical protein
MATKPTIKDMRDLLRTAIEGGIAYWVNEECQNVSIDRSEGWGSDDMDQWWHTKLAFDTDCIGDEMEHYELTPETMLEKFDAWKDYCQKTMKWRWEQWAEALEEDDLGGSCDAEDADCFVQYCLFGEVVFG